MLYSNVLYSDCENAYLCERIPTNGSCNSKTPTNHPCTSMYVSTSFLRELSWPSEVIRSFSSLMVIRYLAWNAVACAFGLQKTSKKTPSSVWRYSMLFHRCGLPACSFSLKVVKRPDMAELNPLADSSENGMVRDVSPMWKVIGVLAATISTKNKTQIQIKICVTSHQWNTRNFKLKAHSLHQWRCLHVFVHFRVSTFNTRYCCKVDAPNSNTTII